MHTPHTPPVNNVFHIYPSPFLYTQKCCISSEHALSIEIEETYHLSPSRRVFWKYTGFIYVMYCICVCSPSLTAARFRLLLLLSSSPIRVVDLQSTSCVRPLSLSIFWANSMLKSCSFIYSPIDG